MARAGDFTGAVPHAYKLRHTRPGSGSMTKPRPMPERGLPAQIAADIGRRITRGDLKPGDMLPKELELLSSLQVSRTTLREALKILSTKGFIEAKPRMGTRVLPADRWNTLDPTVLSWQDDSESSETLAEELFEIRLAIEPVAAGLAARRSTAADRAGIRWAFEAMSRRYDDERQSIEADIAFHLQIIQAAHNRFLLPVSSVIRAALTVSIPKTLRTFGIEHSLDMHEAIAIAIEKGDEEAAEEAARKLIQDTYQRNFRS